MKKLLLNTLKGIFTTGLALFMVFPALSQREKGGGIITKEHVRQITDIVKPVREQLEKQLNGNATYLAYVDDVKRMEASSSLKERNKLSAEMKEKYSGFFKGVWASASVDEASYQTKIRRVFPAELASLIQFSDFLNFTMSSSSSKTQALDSPPTDQCLDICPTAAGEIVTTSAVIGSKWGNSGNCYLDTYALSFALLGTTAGMAETNGYLRNNVSIPGSLPDDARTLRVKVSFDLSQYVICFAVIGGGYAETRLQTFPSNEFLLAYAPLIWYAESSKNKSINENYSLLKKNVSLSSFWSLSKVLTGVGSASTSSTYCRNIIWSICEQK